MTTRWNLDGLVRFLLMVFLLVFHQVELAEAREIRPSDHGLSCQNPAVISPSAAAFFSNSSEVALPEAQNLSNPILGFLAGSSPPAIFRQRKVMTGTPTKAILLMVGLVCAAVGFAFFVAALFVYLVQVRRSK